MENKLGNYNHSSDEELYPQNFGFRFGDSSVHTSRTMMLAELTSLLSSCPESCNKSDYLHAINEDNVLYKKTMSTREKTAKRLFELYALDAHVPVFRVMRKLWYLEERGRPLLACLCAHARDPLLRSTTELILNKKTGDIVSIDEIEQVIIAAKPGKFSDKTLLSTSQNIASSWSQSGHLSGKIKKVRSKATPTPSSVAYALVLGYMTGVRGYNLFNTYWTRLLDASQTELDGLAFDASRNGWIDYKRIGDIVEVKFSMLLPDNTLG